MADAAQLVQELQTRFNAARFVPQQTVDGIPTVWVERDQLQAVLRHLKTENTFRMLYDLTAIDERNYPSRTGIPPTDFTVVYTLFSYDNNQDVRIKVPLTGDTPAISTVTDIWPAANWYERELWDMFGIGVEGHPNLRRILMPPTWSGHPLRKEHPARATEMEPFRLPEQRHIAEEKALQFVPEEWGMQRTSEDSDFMFLNLGPHHPSTHGVFRIILQLDGEVIVDAVPDIGYHHRAAEKMAERQSWHTYIPYTDRVDYLAGVANNLAYLTSLEKLAGIEVPDRAKVIRIMMTELYRISNHLVYYGTYAQDVGAMSPVFYMFADRERIMEITEAVCGGRLHPNWFRIGGVAQDLPRGWDTMVQDLLNLMPKRFAEYDKLVLGNRVFKARTKGVGALSIDDAIEWGVTGPNLRAAGLKWDVRKNRPYGGYDQFAFEIPTGATGDCYDRAVVHSEEMRQSLRIIDQCLRNMPPGPYKSKHRFTTPPIKDNTMKDIETLITHFLNVSWGPPIPPGESMVYNENVKGNTAYYLISDGNTRSYRTRIRTPSFAHLQIIPLLCRGLLVSDLITILGSLDFVMSDVDR